MPDIAKLLLSNGRANSWLRVMLFRLYTSLSYFLAVQKVMGNHSLSLSTWGNPTERSTQGAATDEVYWLANNRYYRLSLCLAWI